MPVRIERAHARDLKLVKPLWKTMIRAYADMSDGMWTVREPQEAWERRHQDYLDWINEGTGVVFLARDEDCVVGYAALHILESGPTFDFGERFGGLESLVVDPKRQGGGVGSLLLSACRKELTRREIAVCTTVTPTNNARAIALLQRYGFAPFMTRFMQRLDDED